MSEFTQIILRLLWRFCPIAWLTTAIVRALARITAWLEDEESWFQLAHSRDDCALVGGWLALAEERLNELIVLKAMQILKRPYCPPRPCGQHLARAVRTPRDIYLRLCRLIALYHDHQRLCRRRAQKLQRLFARAALQLERIHHPVESTTTIFFVLCDRLDDEDFGASRHSGEPAQPIRAPPWPGSFPANPAPSHPARPPRETERSCLQ